RAAWSRLCKRRWAAALAAVTAPRRPSTGASPSTGTERTAPPHGTDERRPAGSHCGPARPPYGGTRRLARAPRNRHSRVVGGRFSTLHSSSNLWAVCTTAVEGTCLPPCAPRGRGCASAGGRPHTGAPPAPRRPSTGASPPTGTERTAPVPPFRREHSYRNHFGRAWPHMGLNATDGATRARGVAPAGSGA